jgi:hypothetical protein
MAQFSCYSNFDSAGKTGKGYFMENMENDGIEALMQSAKAHYWENEYDAAIKDYEKALGIAPNDIMSAKIYWEMGRVHKSKGDSGDMPEFELALADEKKASMFDPNHAYGSSATFLSRGTKYLEKKDYTRAIADCKQSNEFRTDPLDKTMGEIMLASFYRARDLGVNSPLNEEQARELRAQREAETRRKWEAEHPEEVATAKAEREAAAAKAEAERKEKEARIILKSIFRCILGGFIGRLCAELGTDTTMFIIGGIIGFIGGAIIGFIAGNDAIGEGVGQAAGFGAIFFAILGTIIGIMSTRYSGFAGFFMGAFSGAIGGVVIGVFALIFKDRK